MKFLLITNNDLDGVGQQVLNLDKNIRKQGHVSKILALHRFKNNKNIILIKRSFWLRLYSFFFNLIKKNFKTLFSFNVSTIKYNSIKNYVDQSDVIIIYTLHKFLSFSTLQKIFKAKKIIYLRPLDLELATGGCHQNIIDNNNLCEKYISNCNNCPKLNFLNIMNITKHNLKKKKKIFQKFKPKVFLENNFTKKIYNNSSVFKKLETKTLFLGPKQERIKFIKKKKSRQILKLDEKEKIMLFGCFNLDNPLKGGEILKECLNIFVSKLKKDKNFSKYLSKITLLTFGNKNSFEVSISGIKWLHLGIINSDKKLNLLYRASDLLVCPSTVDNGPHIVSEALLNNLPVIAFNQGVAQDCIENGKNGYLVPCYDKKIFSSSIFKALFLDKKKLKKNKISLIFNSSNEAMTIIKHAKNDLKIKNS